MANRSRSVPAADQHTLEEIAEITRRSAQVLNAARHETYPSADEGELVAGKTHSVRFGMKQAALLVGRSAETIRDAERRGLVPAPDMIAGTRRRKGYLLDQVNALRRHFGTLPYRGMTDDPAIISVQNFKGGVGKSAMTSHLAHGFAIRGYRVLVIDADPQGTTTGVFGLNPDLDVGANETLGPFLLRDTPSLRPVVRRTHVSQVDLIPSQLRLNDVEYVMASQIPNDPEVLDMLRAGIRDVAGDYDIVLIDPPPALGMIPLSVLRAANALLIPVRPSMIDFSSSVNFFAMLEEAVETLSKRWMSPAFNWTRILINDVDDGKSMHRTITEMMTRVYGDKMLNTRVHDSAEIDNAAGRLSTVFELTEVSTSKDTRRRALNNLNNLLDEVERLIHTTWPTRVAELREAGKM